MMVATILLESLKPFKKSNINARIIRMITNVMVNSAMTFS